MAYVDPFAKATENFRSIMKSIKERKFLPVYLLCGQETYFTERIVKALSEEVLTPELIRQVYGVKAKVFRDEAGILRIQYYPEGRK